MGYDVFAHGAFGLLMSRHAAMLGGVYGQVIAAADDARSGDRLLRTLAVAAYSARDGHGIVSREAAEEAVDLMGREERIELLPGDEQEEFYNGDAADERLEAVTVEHRDKLTEAFRRVGIVLPERARLHHTGSDDDRPGRTATKADDYVLGFGLFMRPDLYPPMHRTFLNWAEWHTWVTVG